MLVFSQGRHNAAGYRCIDAAEVLNERMIRRVISEAKSLLAMYRDTSREQPR